LEDSLLAAPEVHKLTAKEVASQAWALGELLSGADAVAVRGAMRQIISKIVSNFVFDSERSTEKRKRYRFTGGEICLHSVSELETSGHHVPARKRGHLGMVIDARYGKLSQAWRQRVVLSVIGDSQGPLKFNHQLGLRMYFGK
jgi:hypothetical protein